MPQKRSAVAEALAALNGACSEVSVGWYLFGAQAALLYGAARLTADIDVTVDAGSLPTEDLVAALRRHGVEPRIVDPSFIKNTRVLPVVHTPTHLPIDVVLGGPGLEQLFLSRASRRDVAGALIPVAAAEDLIVMKILAGRDKDLDDVRAILAATGDELDVGQARETLRLLEQALDQGDLLPVLDRLVDEAGLAGSD